MTTHTRSPHPIRLRRSTRILVALAVVSLNVLYGAGSVEYPDNFRRWVHVGTGVILPGTNPQLASEEGMHHVFANQKAADGYSSSNFADGSMIVYELREAQQKSGVIFEGERKRVDVMIKDSGRYKSTGGWRFERFWANDRAQDTVHDSGSSCFACHMNANAHGFVFSQLH